MIPIVTAELKQALWKFGIPGDEMGFTIEGSLCQTCGAPLWEKGEWVGCWYCLTDKATAAKGKALLASMDARQLDRDRAALVKMGFEGSREVGEPGL